MSQFGAKNTPWGRAAAGAQQLNPQIFTGQLGGMGAFVSQAALNSLNAAGISVGALGGGMIPAVNAAAFASPHQAATFGFQAAALGRPTQTQATTAAIVAQQQQQQQQKSQRAFIGTVTKLQDQYGFVDEEVFFQTNVVRGAVPHVGDKVMVEAAYSPNMPFKWNAFRVQLLPNQDPPQIQQFQQQQVQTPIRNVRDDRWIDKRDMQPPPRRERSPLPRRASPMIRRSPPPPRRLSPPIRRRSPSPPLVRPFVPSASLKRERSPRRSATRDTDLSRSPPRRRQRLAPRYNAFVPKYALDLKEANAFEIRKRYTNIYVPSDFFHTKLNWANSFPLNRTLSLDHTVSYQIMHKDVDCLTPGDAVFDPPDADYRYSAKVMLISLPSLQELYNKSYGLQDDGKLKGDDFEPTHPNRLISFLVGLKGKSEVLSIGGPWSPSLDGVDPENDPRVLIRTAIRTTKYLTGVDLSKCTQWFKFLEVRYRRIDKEISKDDASSMDADIAVDRRVDTVVIFVPDVWNVVPTKLEFEGLQNLLKRQLESKLSSLESNTAKTTTPTSNSLNFSSSSPPPPIAADDSHVVVTAADGSQTAVDDERNPDKAEVDIKAEQRFVAPNADDVAEGKPTHWSKLDIKSLKIGELRAELDSRKVDSKGIKSQLVSKLNKIVKDEQEAEEKIAQIEQEANDILTDAAGALPVENRAASNEKIVELVQKDEPKPIVVTEPEKPVDERELKKKREREEKEKREKKKDLEKHLVFSSPNPGIVVYPHKTAKGGKFDCKVMTLAALMDYRPEDNKEHSFEVALFAEAFNEMLLRDGAFSIYKSLVVAPEKEEEKKEKKGSKKSSKDEKNVANESKNEDTQVSQDSSAVSEPTNADQTNAVDSSTTNADESQNTTLENKDQTPQKDQEKQDKEKSKKRKSRSRSRDKEDKKSSTIVVKDPALFFSFCFFDLAQCGYLFDRDIEEILLSLSLQLTRAQIQKLLKKVLSKDSFNYRKLTDSVTAKDGKVTKVELQTTIDDAELALGNSFLLPWNRLDAGENLSKIQKSGYDSETVVYQGSVVNVGQVLEHLDRLEKEQKILELRHVTLEKDLKHSKEQKESLERRKRRLEEDVRDYKKRLYDAEKCLKNSQDDTVQLKTSLQRCKEMGESICRTVDKALPKREPSSERSVKSNKSDKQKENVQKEERNGEKTELKQISSSNVDDAPSATVANETAHENCTAEEEFVVKDEIVAESADGEAEKTSDVTMAEVN